MTHNQGLENQTPDKAGASRWLWSPLIGLAVPFTLIVSSSLFAAHSAQGPFGIAWPIIWLFVCAPLTSLCLAACWALFDRKTPENKSALET